MNRQSHLDYDQLLQALVDKADLRAEAHAHLETCPDCQRQVGRLFQHYDRLGRMAKKMAPQPSRPIRIESRLPSTKRRQFNPAMALAVVGLLIFVFSVWWPQPTGHSDRPVPMMAQHFENDDHLMEEIDALVDDALPEAYQQMAALSEDRSMEDLDELIDWVVPAPEEGDDFEQPVTSSRETRQKQLARSDLAFFAEEGMV